MNTQPSMGVNPAYICIDASGSMVLASNHGSYNPAVTVVQRYGVPQIEKVYDDGTVSMLPVRPDCRLAPASDVAVLDRLSGVDPVSQQSPHAHSVNFDPDNRFVIVCASSNQGVVPAVRAYARLVSNKASNRLHARSAWASL